MKWLRGITLSLLLGLLVTPATARGTGAQAAPSAAGPRAELLADVDRREEALRALQRVTARKRDLVGTTGARRRALVDQVVEAYRAVRRAHPEVRDISAEVSFRAGELLRAAGRAEEAEIEFRAAFDLGTRTPFRARAGIELGHLRRRAGLHEEALAEYERVRSDGLVDPEPRTEATWWAARMQELLGQPAAAVRLYDQVASSAEDPIDRIRGFDSWAALLVHLGDLEGAAGVLDRCGVELRDRALEETRFGRRVRSSLEGMRARALLERAVAERRAGRAAPLELPARSPEEQPAVDDGAGRTPPSLPPPRTRALRRMGTSSDNFFPPAGARVSIGRCQGGWEESARRARASTGTLL